MRARLENKIVFLIPEVEQQPSGQGVRFVQPLAGMRAPTEDSQRGRDWHREIGLRLNLGDFAPRRTAKYRKRSRRRDEIANLLRTMRRIQFGPVDRVSRDAHGFSGKRPSGFVIGVPVVTACRIEGEHEIRLPRPDSLDEAIDNVARNAIELTIWVFPQLLMVDPQSKPVSPQFGFSDQGEIFSARETGRGLTVLAPSQSDGSYVDAFTRTRVG